MTRRGCCRRLAVAVALLAMSAYGAAAENCAAFSRYLGGSGKDVIRDVATDRQGNVYVTGATTSPDFPVTPGAYGSALSRPGPRGHDVFVTKLDSNGKIVWSALIGGPNYDRAYAVEVDREGYVYVAGRAGAGFPVTPGAFQTTFHGGQASSLYGPQDGFVCKLRPDGTALVFCSYFGTSDPQIVRDLAIDDHGDIYVASSRSGGAFPASWFAGALQATPAGGHDAVAAKIAADGSRVLWATYLGGAGNESGENSIRVDSTGHAYILLTTPSTGMPTTPGAYDRTLNGGRDVYVAKLTPDGSRLVYGTYLGGSRDEDTETHELAIDAEGNAYVASTTLSPDFPTTAGALQATYGGTGGSGSGGATNYPGDVFVAKLSSDGSSLLASTFIGGHRGEGAEGVAVDAEGNVYVSGATYSDDFPLTPGAIQGRRRGGADAFAVKLSSDLRQLLYSTYWGGSGRDYGRTAGVDFKGSMYIAGTTQSSDLPACNAPRNRGRGGKDAFVAKITFPGAAGRNP